MEKYHKLKKYIFIFFLIILFIPMIQEKFEFSNIKPLRGAITPLFDSSFALKKWFNSTYQEHKEKYINDNFGFRNYFVRLNNQIVYSLFSKAKAAWVVVGKDNYLYEQGYIDAYYGRDFIGKDSANNLFKQLKVISDYMHSLNKKIVIVYSPGKARFFPEYIPERFKTIQTQSNYNYFLKKTQELKIDYIDFNNYFIENKNKAKYPLFPKHGIHWSHYGMLLASDSIIKFTENLLDINMMNIDNENISYLKKDKDSIKEDNLDYDLLFGLNKVFNDYEKDLVYPIFKFKNDSNTSKPNSIFITDSFFWGILGYTISEVCNNDFWFYFKEANPSKLDLKNLDIRKIIEKVDIIYIMPSESNLKDFGWGFIQQAYIKLKDSKLIYEQEINKKMLDLIIYIKSDEKWMNDIVKKSKEKNISIDSMIYIDAKWTIENQK